MEYNVDYFLNKFSKIPKNKWTTGTTHTQSGKMCMLGFCGDDANHGLYRTPESMSLRNLLQPLSGWNAWHINDGGRIEINHLGVDFSELGDHPKERVLNALMLVKAGVSFE